MDYSKIITIEAGKRSGKPCLRGLRITVHDVLEYLASGMSHEDILRDFPYLTEEDIRACLAYAADAGRRTAHAHRPTRPGVCVSAGRAAHRAPQLPAVLLPPPPFALLCSALPCSALL